MHVKTFSLDEIDKMIELHRKRWNPKIKLAIIGRVISDKNGIRFQIIF